MSLYFIRHGYTDWNRQMLIQGQVEIPLNEEGRKQVNEEASKIKDIHFDVVISSPQSRALETASILHEGRDIPLITDKRIREEYYGRMEGKPRQGEVYFNQRKKLACRYPGGESYLDVAARIYPFLDDVKKKYKDQDVLIVAHGGISRVIESYFVDDMTNEQFIEHICPNCTLVKYEWPDRDFRK